MSENIPDKIEIMGIPFNVRSHRRVGAIDITHMGNPGSEIVVVGHGPQPSAKGNVVFNAGSYDNGVDGCYRLKLICNELWETGFKDGAKAAKKAAE